MRLINIIALLQSTALVSHCAFSSSMLHICATNIIQTNDEKTTAINRSWLDKLTLSEIISIQISLWIHMARLILLYREYVCCLSLGRRKIKNVVYSQILEMVNLANHRLPAKI